MPVFERTEGNDRLLDLVNQEARAFGIPAFGAAHPGGCSDASFMAQAGIPILDSVGVQGMGPIPSRNMPLWKPCLNGPCCWLRPSAVCDLL